MSLSSCEEFMQEYKKGEFLEVPINTIDLSIKTTENHAIAFFFRL